MSVVRGNGDPSKDRISALKLARQCLEQAQQRMRLTSNKHRRHIEFQVGDFVLLSAKNLELKFEGTKKLMHKYFGPFEIVRRVGAVAYELKIPLSMGVHDVFHVSLLKLYKKAGAVKILVPPPALLPCGGLEFEVEKILNHRVLENGCREFLVRWKDDDQDTWLEEVEMSNCAAALEEYCKLVNIPMSRFKRPRNGKGKRPGRPSKSLRIRGPGRPRKRAKF